MTKHKDRTENRRSRVSNGNGFSAFTSKALLAVTMAAAGIGFTLLINHLLSSGHSVTEARVSTQEDILTEHMRESKEEFSQINARQSIILDAVLSGKPLSIQKDIRDEWRRAGGK